MNPIAVAAFASFALTGLIAAVQIVLNHRHSEPMAQRILCHGQPALAYQQPDGTWRCECGWRVRVVIPDSRADELEAVNPTRRADTSNTHG